MVRKPTVSQSELTAKEIFDSYLLGIQHLDNFRPDWLEGMELDRYYPTLGVAIEFQGDQHFRVVPGMHKGPADFQKQVDLDRRKRQICEQNGVKLYDITILDLDRFRVKDLMKKVARDGLNYARLHGNKSDAYKIERIRFGEPDEDLMERVDRLSHIRKQYYRPNKKSWWKKLLRI